MQCENMREIASGLLKMMRADDFSSNKFLFKLQRRAMPPELYSTN